MRLFRQTALAMSILVASVAQADSSDTYYLNVGKLLADPATGEVLTEQTLTIQNGKISDLKDGYTDNEDAIDLKNAFVLPGLIDSHVHLTSQQGVNSRLARVTQSDADYAMIGANHARKTLYAGFTTVADLGGSNEAVFALRDAIKRGDVVGPNIIAAGAAVAVHGGHGDANGYSPEVLNLLRRTSICSGAADCRRAVRMQVQGGADVIKITATGGVLSDTAAGLAQQFTQDELESIVEVAHRMGRKVTAHAHGVDGINAFLKAGGDSIEHGTYLDDESIELLKSEDKWLVPTLLAGDFVARVASGPDNFFTQAQTDKALEVGPNMLDMAKRAHAAGVKIAFGTDTGVSAHGDNAQEFALLVKAGMKPLEAIQAATVNAAEHLDISDKAGKIALDRPADLIAVKNNPLDDITELERVVFVMKDGVVHKNTLN